MRYHLADHRAKQPAATPRVAAGSGAADLLGMSPDLFRGPVDIVLTYVDGSAPGFEEEYRAVVGQAPPPCHVRSLGKLRYALRSIHEHAPWVRNTLLIVNDLGHLPPWLNGEAVRPVCLDEFMPEEALPCFNPFAIQAWAHRIVGLARHFVLWSDDQMVLHPTTLGDFFLADGRPRVPLVAASPYTPPEDAGDRFGTRLANGFRALDELLSRDGFTKSGKHPLASHLPIPVERGLWISFLDDFLEVPAFRDTVFSRCRDGTERTPTRMTVLELWFAWLWAKGKPPFSHRLWGGPIRALRRRVEGLGLLPATQGSFSVRHDPEWTGTEMERLLRRRPRFACVNDEAYYPHRDPHGVVWEGQMELEPNSLELLLETLEKLFPRRSVFESEA